MDSIAKLIEELDVYSGNQLKRKEDLSTLIHLGYSNNQNEIIEELSFTSKYVQGLLRILNRASGSAEFQNIDQIKIDLSRNMEKVKDLIEQLLVYADDSAKRYFRENYLQLSQNSMFNLTELMNDFEWTKKYLNRVKRANPS
jgi:DNA-binding protein YbaB